MVERSGGDGKELEHLVAAIESLLVPRGFTVETNQREYNNDGIQVGEFDITIRGNIGSAKIACLIECRNRPSEGPAPSSWIQQLGGRRLQFKFDKVIAASTTGFAAGAIEFSKTAGIDLREMSQLDQVALDLAAWISMRVLHSQEVRHTLKSIRLHISEREIPERQQAVTTVVIGARPEEPLLRSTKTGETVSAAVAFQVAAGQLPYLYEDIVPNQPPKHVTFSGNYLDDEDHYVVDTAAGPVRITSIDFEGAISINQTDVPMSQFSEYRTVGSKEPVSQTASFTFPVGGQTLALDLHHLTHSGETHIAVRPTGAESTETPQPRPPKTKKS
jgi:hypothetical protein